MKQAIHSQSRSGTTLLEVIAAVTLLGAGLALTAQSLHTTSLLRRENERRQCAIQEAANVLEQIRGLPLAELSPDSPPAVALSAEVKAQLPAAQLSLEITPAEVAGEARRLTVQISWKTRYGQLAAPVRLTAWRWPRETPP